MFTNLESKLKGLAEIILAAGIISSILLGIIIIGHDAWAVGIIILIYGMITSFISSFSLYGFALLLEKVSKISENIAPSEPSPPINSAEKEEKLRILKKWNEDGLISEQEYTQKKNIILNK